MELISGMKPVTCLYIDRPLQWIPSTTMTCVVIKCREYVYFDATVNIPICGIQEYIYIFVDINTLLFSFHLPKMHRCRHRIYYTVSRPTGHTSVNRSPSNINPLNPTSLFCSSTKNVFLSKKQVSYNPKHSHLSLSRPDRSCR